MKRLKHGQILGNLVVRRIGLIVVHLGQNPRAHDALILGVLSNIVRNVHIQAVRQQPAHAAFGIARQPPVLDDRRLGRFGSRAARRRGARS